MVRLLPYVHALIHDPVFCAIECFMEIKVWPIKHSVRLGTQIPFYPPMQVTLYVDNWCCIHVHAPGNYRIHIYQLDDDTKCLHVHTRT